MLQKNKEKIVFGNNKIITIINLFSLYNETMLQKLRRQYRIWSFLVYLSLAMILTSVTISLFTYNQVFSTPLPRESGLIIYSVFLFLAILFYGFYLILSLSYKKKTARKIFNYSLVSVISYSLVLLFAFLQTYWFSIFSEPASFAVVILLIVVLGIIILASDSVMLIEKTRILARIEIQEKNKVVTEKGKDNLEKKEWWTNKEKVKINNKKLKEDQYFND